MDQLQRLQEFLGSFSADQKEAVAEIAAFDWVLSELWQDNVAKCIKDDCWQPDVLLERLIERVEEIVSDCEQYGFFTEFGNNR